MVRYKVRKEPESFINKTFVYKVTDDNKVEICSGSLVFYLFSDMYKFAVLLSKMYEMGNIKVNIINNKNVANTR